MPVAVFGGVISAIHHWMNPIEFFPNNTNLTLLAILRKIDIEGFQDQQNLATKDIC